MCTIPPLIGMHVIEYSCAFPTVTFENISLEKKVYNRSGVVTSKWKGSLAKLLITPVLFLLCHESALLSEIYPLLATELNVVMSLNTPVHGCHYCHLGKAFYHKRLSSQSLIFQCRCQSVLLPCFFFLMAMP